MPPSRNVTILVALLLYISIVLTLIGVAPLAVVNAQSLQSQRQVDEITYQERKAAGLLPAPPQARPTQRSTSQPLVELTSMPTLLIPRDGSFSVAPFTSGNPPLYRNDDGSTDTIPLPFTFRFFGAQYRRVFINNNGNISFLQQYGTYSSTGFPITGYDMIAAFWADVDTRNDTSGVVYYRVEAHRLVVIWDQVGYYGSNADKLNTFEIIITDGTDPLVGAGKNVALSYDDMQWTTGDASSGVNGFGGTPAAVGANRGDGTNYALIGRFDHAGTDYDGPGGNADGVSYLDGKTFTFNIAQGLGTIAGTVFHDLNGNCVKDTLESPLVGWTVRLQPTNAYTTTDSLGKYLFSFLNPGTYTVSEVLRPNWQRTCPAAPGTYTVDLDSGQSIGNRVFSNTPIPGAQDLAVSVAGGTARRGSTKQYGIRVDNRGIVAVSPSVRFSLPAGVTHSLASTGGVFDAGGWVDWNLGSVAAGTTRWLWERVYIPTGLPSNTILACSVAVTPLAGDLYPENNSDSDSEEVSDLASPNELSVSPDSGATIATTLEYTIRFQNTGNDTTFNMRITDSLGTDYDLSMVEPGAASHPYAFHVVSPRELVFDLADIHLPDSGHSQETSQGFVKFAVRPRADILPGVILSNRAAIFFDVNAPVFTNTVTNQIGSGPAIAVISPAEGVTLVGGSEVTVTWISSEVSGNVNIRLSTDGGVSFPFPLTSNTPNDEEEQVLLPVVSSNACRMRVESSTEPSIYGDSPGNFSILRGAITVTSPLGGVTAIAGSKLLVAWTSLGITDSLEILLSPNGGSSFPFLLASGVPDDGSRETTLPMLTSTTCRIRVRSVTDSIVFGDNPGLFAIIEASILVVSPSAGITRRAGELLRVDWTSNNLPGNVTVKLSTDGGSTFPLTLVSETPNDGHDSITVPNAPSTTCRIRVESSIIPSVHGDNPGDFTITAGFIIYPGDANNDGIVNVRDIIPLGRYFNASGPVRPNASLDWGPQILVQGWNPLDACYADCDGNGRVDATDVQAIISNWFRTHTGPDSSVADPRAVCETLLREIDAAPVLSDRMKLVRNAVVAFMRANLGISFDYALEQNYPNPFNPKSTIRFTVPDELPSVDLSIFNMLGQRIWEVRLPDVQPGSHEVEWLAKNSSGIDVGSGIYIYRLLAGDHSFSKKMILMR